MTNAFLKLLYQKNKNQQLRPYPKDKGYKGKLPKQHKQYLQGKK